MNIDQQNGDTNARLDELERKWLDGSISVQEMEEYANWYNKDQNKRINVPENIANSHDQHEQLLLNNILDAIEINKKGHEFGRLTNLNRFWYYSAALLIFFIGIISIYKYNEKKQASLTDMAIAPGEDGMVLLDGQGKSIKITNLGNGWQKTSDGLEFKKTSNFIQLKRNNLKNIYNTAITEVGQKFEVILPDGTAIYLNSKSRLKFPVSTNETTRLIELEGEAYFNVIHNTKSPFIVKANGIEIKDIGTKFNVQTYQDDGFSKITLLEGNVQITTKSNIINMKPKESFQWNSRQMFHNQKNTDTLSPISWIKGEFSFDNTSLLSIAKKLERWYNIDVTFSNTVDQEMLFSGGTPMNKNLQVVLDVLSFGGVHYVLKGRHLEFIK